MKTLPLLLCLGVWFLALGAARADDAADASPRLSEERVVLQTSAGPVSVVLYPDVAPSHVARFLRMVRAGVYEHTAFNFIEPGYYLQVGTLDNRRNPLTAEQESVLKALQPELGDLHHEAGTLSFPVVEGTPFSAESSFSILLSDSPQLDHHSTAFGKVEKGMDVLTSLANVGHGKDLHPSRPIEIVQAQVVSARREADERLKDLTAVRDNALNIRFAMLTFLLIFLVSTGNFLLRKRFDARVQSALTLVNALLASFALLVLVTPLTTEKPLLGGGIFMGMVGLFKLMNRFESA